MQLEGKSVIVTGSSSGIGRAAALALANAGADVVVNGNTKMEAAEEVAHQIEGLGRKSLAVQADVSNGEDVGLANDVVAELSCDSNKDN